MAMDHHQVILRLRSTVGEEWLAPPELRPRLLAIAEERGSNLTDVVVDLLSSHYGIEAELTGRRSTPRGGVETMTVRLPRALHEAVSRSAGQAYPKLSIPDEVRRVLCESVGLAVAA